MLCYTCSACGDPIDPKSLKRYCSYECMKDAREEWVKIHQQKGFDPPPFPRIGHYSDAPGVGEWTPEEMQARIYELKLLSHPNA